MMEYLICHHRKSWPTISVAVCRKCKRMDRCKDYHQFTYPSLFHQAVANRTVRKKPLPQKIPTGAETGTGPIQLSFNFRLE